MKKSIFNRWIQQQGKQAIPTDNITNKTKKIVNYRWVIVERKISSPQLEGKGKSKKETSEQIVELKRDGKKVVRKNLTCEICRRIFKCEQGLAYHQIWHNKKETHKRGKSRFNQKDKQLKIKLRKIKADK